MSISTRTAPPVASRWAEAEASKKAKKQDTRRKMFLWIGAVVLAALLAIGVWELGGLYKEHKHQQFIDSIKNDPDKIRAAADAKQITDDEHEALRRDAFEERMNKMMDTYFALAPADRSAWMQQRVKADIARRAQWQQMAAGATSRPWGGNGNNGGPQNQNNNNAASRTARYESRDPNRAAQFSQFRNDMAAAYRQMGLQPPHRGR